jgi:hypothetical protein
VARSRRARRRAGDELWALRAAIVRALRVRRRTGIPARSALLPVVLAVLALPFALAGAGSVALLSPAESESGREADPVRVSAPPDHAEAHGNREGHPRAPERRGERRRGPAPAPVPVAAPAEPAAPAPAVPAAAEPPAADPPAKPSPDTPGRADLEQEPPPEARERAPSGEERLLEPPPAEPAPEEPPAPPAGEPLPAQPGETDVSEDGSAPAPEVPAAP